jgi:hypothetical protein
MAKHKFLYGQVEIHGDVGGPWRIFHCCREISPHGGFFTVEEAYEWLQKNRPELAKKPEPEPYHYSWDYDSQDYGI